jgi:hypothetical protein
MDRPPVLRAYVLILLGFLLAVFVASFFPTPAPPACSTATCNASYWSGLIGILFLLIGIIWLTLALFRRPATASGAPAPPGYSFPSSSPPTPAAPSPAPRPPATAPSAPFCPSCGTYVSPGATFCPKCGRTLPP